MAAAELQQLNKDIADATTDVASWEAKLEECTNRAGDATGRRDYWRDMMNGLVPRKAKGPW